MAVSATNKAMSAYVTFEDEMAAIEARVRFSRRRRGRGRGRGRDRGGGGGGGGCRGRGRGRGPDHDRLGHEAVVSVVQRSVDGRVVSPYD